MQRVVPLGVELVRGHLQLRHSDVGDFDPSRIHFRIQHRFDTQPGFGPRCADQIDDGLIEEKTRNGILSTLSGCSGDMGPGAERPKLIRTEGGGGFPVVVAG